MFAVVVMVHENDLIPFDMEENVVLVVVVD
jgi:hypothetical protein